MEQINAWLESTGLARSVGESLSMTAWLSATHLIGFTLVMSGALMWNLKAAGLMLRGVSTPEIARPAMRVLLCGLLVSLVTGVALYAPRASSAWLSGAFRLKVGLLLVAATFQLTIHAWSLQRLSGRAPWLRSVGFVGLALWLALAAAACWFILFE